MPLIEHADATITVDTFRRGEGAREAFVKVTVHNGRANASIRLPAAKLAELLELCIQAKWKIEEKSSA